MTKDQGQTVVIRAVALAFVLLAGGLTSLSAEAGIAASWLGQDGHDFCGEETDAIKPNGVQDVHIAVTGLPVGREITFATIQGHGSGEWQYRGVQNRAGAVMTRRPKGATADLYIDPYQVETGREFSIKFKFDDGTVTELYFKGGKADPAVHMPGAGVAGRWVGQERMDQAGSGPGVGPDGFQDARLDLSKLSAKGKVASIMVEDSGGDRWAFGPNPNGHHNAEFVVNEKVPTEGSLFFQPMADLTSRKLKVTVVYDNGKTDATTVVAGRTDPKLLVPKVSLPRIAPVTLKSRWVGQESGSPDVRVSISGLPTTKAIAAAVLSDGVRGVWVFRANDKVAVDVEPGSNPLIIRRGNDRASADLLFSPYRDESKTTLTLRLIFQDGESVFAAIPGGPCDPTLRAPRVERTEVTAKPGDDLGDLANRFGTVRLAKGEYLMRQPLVLKRPVSLVGEAGSVLMFSQGSNDAAWTTAIKIHAGNTTLKGFTARFAGPVRWRNDVSWSPSVIGTTDNFDAGPNSPKVNLTFEKLDLEAPPKGGSAPWEDAVKLLRLVEATSGKVVGNVLRGGVVEVFGGPWEIADNDYRGAPVGTFSPGVFVVHDPSDVVVRNNRAKSVGPSGKTWRFVVFTQRGHLDRVENNVVEGIGPRDDDTIPAANAPEIVLTESYHVLFEGKPSGVSADGRLVKISPISSLAARTGDVVSVVSGKGAGQWRRIAQRIDPALYLLDSPLPKGAEVLSITPGFINETFAGNKINARGGRAAAGFVLAGNHFGTRVLNNTVVGAGDAFQLSAYPSESPKIWGWSHAPFLGGIVEGNTVEDSERGASIGVYHGGYTKSSKGRVYMTLTLKGNTVRWSDAFLSRLATTPAKSPDGGLILGYKGSLDPAELVVTESDNRLIAPPSAPATSALEVRAALMNGQVVKDRAYRLPTERGQTATGREAVAPGTGLPRR